ncbi:MAG: hypothetical protein AAGI38_20055 [Bacteroidota bacterium]
MPITESDFNKDFGCNWIKRSTATLHEVFLLNTTPGYAQSFELSGSDLQDLMSTTPLENLRFHMGVRSTGSLLFQPFVEAVGAPAGSASFYPMNHTTSGVLGPLHKEKHVLSEGESYTTLETKGKTAGDSVINPDTALLLYAGWRDILPHENKGSTFQLPNNSSQSGRYRHCTMTIEDFGKLTTLIGTSPAQSKLRFYIGASLLTTIHPFMFKAIIEGEKADGTNKFYEFSNPCPFNCGTPPPVCSDPE